jgi:hypothetical protein
VGYEKCTAGTHFVSQVKNSSTKGSLSNLEHTFVVVQLILGPVHLELQLSLILPNTGGFTEPGLFNKIHKTKLSDKCLTNVIIGNIRIVKE